MSFIKTKTCIFILFVFVCSSIYANTVSLKWKINEKERLEVLKTAHIENYINGELQRVYYERNIIDLTCFSITKQGHNVNGSFSTFTRNSNESVFKKTHEEASSFIIKPNGHYIIPPKHIMPNLRDIPVFPVGSVKIGDSWKAPGEIIVTSFSVPFSLQMPVSYTLSEVKEVDGTPIAVIEYTYFLNQSNTPGSVPADFPVKIVGEDKGVVLWDLKKNAPLIYKNNYHILFIFKTANGATKTIEWKMSIDTKHTTYKPEKTNKKTLKEELEKEKDILVDENEKGIVIRLGELLFDFDSAKLNPKSEKILANILDAVKSRYPDREIIVEGHTDNTGNPHYNKELSEKRAKNVAGYMLKGLSHDKVSYIGHGETQPIETNNTMEGRKKNRRVDIIIKLK